MSSRRSIARGIACILLLLSIPSGVRSLQAQSDKKTAAQPADEFFIVSSVDPVKQQLLLKHPTEVTDLIKVSSATVYVDQDGKRLTLGDLRAGDTVYVTLSRAGSIPTASRVRKGPMTVQELRRRYLH